MVYITSGGNLSNNKQWGFSRITNFFWSILNFFTLFLQTLLNPYLTRHGDGYESSSYRPNTGGHGPPPGFPRRRVGGLARMGGAGAPPPPAGG